MALSLGFSVSVGNISRFNMLEIISFRIYPATRYKRMVTEQQRQWKPEQHPFIPGAVNKCVDSGRTLYEVQQILGHSDSKVTERYAHMSTETLQAAANSVTDYMDRALDKTSEQYF
jgi:hypothetical protein